MRQPQGFPAYPDIGFHLVIPGGDIGIAYRPVYRDPILAVGLKIKIAPAVTLAAPGNRAATYVVPPDPVKPLGLHIRVFQVIDEEMFDILLGGPANAYLFVVLSPVFGGEFVPVGEVPQVHVHRRVIRYVFNHAAPFQDQGFQPVLAKLFRRPPSGDSGSYDNCVVLLSLIHWVFFFLF